MPPLADPASDTGCTDRARDIERVDVSEPASISAGIADRYATALFELAKSDKTLDQVERDIDTLQAMIDESEDLRDLITSPVYSRDEMRDAMLAIAKAAGFGMEVTNTLGLMAEKRRLFVLPQMIRALKAKIADHKGEVSAEVRTAKPLTEEQAAKLRETLKAKVGKDVQLTTTVDESLIGGLVVKVGSRMIDTSIASRLAQLQNTMKEAR